MTQQEKNTDKAAMLVVLGISVLMIRVSVSMVYAGYRGSWVPATLSVVLSLALPAYARKRGLL